MRKFASALTVLVLVSGASAAQAAALRPMTAVYSVTRDGKAIGDATYTLKSNGDGTWTLTSITRGTSGMARVLGLDVREESTFRWQDGKLQGVSYDYRQDAAIRHKQRHIEFDWTAKQARVLDGKNSFAYAIPAGAMDRSSVALVLGEALTSGIRDLTLPVVVRDRVEQQHFVAHAEEPIQVPAGSFKAIKFERVDAAGKASSWYAPTIAMLPLRVEQVQHDGATIVLELKQR
ncbi:MAG: DUF3108 domain-containing protein [Rudaea sp.]